MVKRRDDWAEIVNLTCRRFIEERLGVKMTNRQFNAYCKAVSEIRAQEELEAAIALVESRGLRVGGQE